ncbi:DUF3696 domain-containing protein [Neobacillus cucumis]|nr:DUF3696 domain-containing protein [Neobacillus cucumis]
MIKNWSLGHFKSVFYNTTLEMAPLTIFTGANSSGKSTIIQSLLLTTQTIQNNVHTRSLILNGHIIKLGTFDDILSNDPTSSKISIGFELDNDLSQIKLERRLLFRRYYTRNLDKQIIKCNFSFSSNSKGNVEVSNLHPTINTCEITVESFDNENKITNENILISKTIKDLKDRKEELKLNNLSINDEPSLEYEVKIKGQNNIYRLPINGKIVGVTLLHFLPDKLAAAFNEVEENARETVEIFGNPSDYSIITDKIEHNKQFEKHIIELINTVNKDFFDTYNGQSTKKIRVAEKFNLLKTDFSLKNLKSYLQLLPKKYSEKYFQLVRTNESKLIGDLTREKEPRFSLAQISIPPFLEIGVNYIRDYFSRNVKYLGPLRDEPKPIYPHSGATDSKDVGFKGEHTAAVLEVHKNTRVDYISPSNLLNSGVIKPKNDTLLNAVLEWLNYMGVVKNVQTIDRGKLGHELKVTTENGSSFHDLTNVGVGVSQVLPILVLSLLADKGSTLIFEQPELHLHPRVQTRLADFFVSMIKMKKQCIVESHSEYLINRLRYFSAISETDEIANDVMMYFVEKENGKSLYRPVRINRYGVIEEWPKGFFDENEENAAAILRAAMKKKKKESKFNNDRFNH